MTSDVSINCTDKHRLALCITFGDVFHNSLEISRHCRIYKICPVVRYDIPDLSGSQ